MTLQDNQFLPQTIKILCHKCKQPVINVIMDCYAFISDPYEDCAFLCSKCYKKEGRP